MDASPYLCNPPRTLAEAQEDIAMRNAEIAARQGVIRQEKLALAKDYRWRAAQARNSDNTAHGERLAGAYDKLAFECEQDAKAAAEAIEKLEHGEGR